MGHTFFLHNSQRSQIEAGSVKIPGTPPRNPATIPTSQNYNCTTGKVPAPRSKHRRKCAGLQNGTKTNTFDGNPGESPNRKQFIII